MYNAKVYIWLFVLTIFNEGAYLT